MRTKRYRTGYLALFFALFATLVGCTGHWGTLRYYGKETEITDADFRLDVGWNYLSDIEGDVPAQEARLKQMLIDEVTTRGECSRGNIVDIRFGCLELVGWGERSEPQHLA